VPVYTTPGVYFETLDVGRGGIAAIRTDVPAFLGIAERGSLDTPTRVGSWQQFASLFGGFLAAGYLAYAVKAFFENGGRAAWVVRVAAQGATAAAEGVFRDRSGRPVLRLSAASPGSWGNRLGVRLGGASPAATRTAAVPQPEDRGSSVVDTVVGFDPGALVRLHQGAAELHRVVERVDPVRRRLHWDRPLDAALDLRRPVALETVELSLTILADGRVSERFPRLSLHPRHPRYVEAEVAAESSSLIRVEDLGRRLGAPLEERWPDRRSPLLDRGVLTLAGGLDGLAALAPRDFTGEPGAGPRRGLRSLEQVDEVAMVAAPDLMARPAPPVLTAPRPAPRPDPCLTPGEPELPAPEPSGAPPASAPDEQPPGFTLEQVYAVQEALVSHAESLHDRVALLDAPRFDGGRGAVDLGEIRAWRRRFDTSFAALYYPWVEVYDPLAPGPRLRALPPSGHVAGVFARTDLGPGVHKAPANAELRWAQGLTREVGPEEQGFLNPLGVNCLRTFPGRGIRLYGARTLSLDPRWRYVNVRRLLLMIEEAVEESSQWAVFEPNDAVLRHTLRLAISSFLESLWARGALAGTTPAEAFFVRCDEENNPPEVTEAGRLFADVGVAPAVPAELVVFRIGRTEDELEVVGEEGGEGWH